MAARAKAAVLKDFGQPLAIRELDVPELVPGAALVRVIHGGICGTDVHLAGGHLTIPTPLVLGHEGVGEVVALGEGLTHDALGNPLHPGDRVGWASSIACGRCYWCLTLQERTLCPQRRIYGINQPADRWPGLSGSWAELTYLQPGSTLVRIPPDVTTADVISLGCAGPTVVHGLLHVTGVALGEVVVVQGSGPVGMAAAMFAHLAGASKVILVGGPAGRLELARQLGVGDVHVNIFEVTDPAERVRRVLAETEQGRGADVVVECVGLPEAVAEGLQMVRASGRYLVLGHYTDHGTVPINPHWITRKQLKVLGSWGLSEAHYVEYVRSLQQLRRRFDLSRLVRPYPLEAVNQALEDVRKAAVMKAALQVG